MLIYIWLAWMFVFGTVIGSFLNVLIYRLPRGMSPFAPPSHCPQCHNRVRWHDNLPLVSYALLRGRCRHCAAPIPARYPAVELATGIAFAAAFALGIMFDWHRNIQIGGEIIQLYVWQGAVSIPMWVMAFAHAALFSLALVGVMCEREGFPPPGRLSVIGLGIALVASALGPWPTPSSQIDLKSQAVILRSHGLPADGVLTVGQQPWPLWHPLPEGVPAGSVELGLATAAAGSGVGALLGLAVWAVLPGRFRPTWTLPAGPAFLAMLGGFLGWQPLAVAVALAVPLWLSPALAGRPVATLSVAAGAVWLSWWWLGPRLEPAVHDPEALAVAAAALAGLMALVSLRLRPAGRSGTGGAPPG